MPASVLAALADQPPGVLHTGSLMLVPPQHEATLQGMATLAARGWTRDGGDLWETLERLERDGCQRYVVTDVTKDGTLRGPNTDLLERMCARTDQPVIASGGAGNLDHLADVLGAGKADAVLAASIFHFGEYTIGQAKRHMASSGLRVRLD